MSRWRGDCGRWCARRPAKGDGDALTIALDGDVDEEVKRFQHCRVVGNFLEEGDTFSLGYPNASIDCADIPELEGWLIW